jgi:hypothetical protein
MQKMSVYFVPWVKKGRGPQRIHISVEFNSDFNLVVRDSAESLKSWPTRRNNQDKKWRLMEADLNESGSNK